MTHNDWNPTDGQVPLSGVQGITSEIEDKQRDDELREAELDPSRVGGSRKKDKDGSRPIMPISGIGSGGGAGTAPAAGAPAPGSAMIPGAAAMPGATRSNVSSAPPAGTTGVGSRNSYSSNPASGAPGAASAAGGVGMAPGAGGQQWAAANTSATGSASTSAAPGLGGLGGVSSSQLPGAPAVPGSPTGMMAAGDSSPIDSSGADLSGMDSSSTAQDSPWASVPDAQSDGYGSAYAINDPQNRSHSSGALDENLGGSALGSTSAVIGGSTADAWDGGGLGTSSSDGAGSSSLNDEQSHLDGASSQDSGTRSGSSLAQTAAWAVPLAGAAYAYAADQGYVPTPATWGLTSSGSGQASGSSSSNAMRPGDYAVQTDSVYTLAQQWNMLSQDVREASQPTQDRDLGIASAYSGTYDSMNTRATAWSAGATSETARVSESLDQVAAGYDWIEDENVAVGGVIMDVGTLPINASME